MSYKDPFQQHFDPTSYSSPQLTYSVQVTPAFLLFLEHILYHIEVLVLLIIPKLDHSCSQILMANSFIAFHQPFSFE